MIKFVILGIIAIYISLFFGFQSCTFQNEEDYFATCDTTAVVYSDLTYIFIDVCATCHNSISTPRPGIVMDSYENVKKSFETGKVLPALKHEGVYKMPKNRSKLTDCELQKIEAWYNNNMPTE